MSTALIAGGFVGLAAGVPAALALVAYGAGNGIWSIVRGTLPLALFGPEDYPALIGRIALPALVTGAAAPFAMAYLIEGSGAGAGPRGAPRGERGARRLLAGDARRARRYGFVRCGLGQCFPAG